VSIAYTDLPSDARVIRETKEAADRGANVTLLVPRSSDTRCPAGLENSEIYWLAVPEQRGHTTLFGQYRFMRAIAEWRRGRSAVPDIVHVHNMPDYLYWAVRDWHQAGARVVLDVHDIMSHLAVHRFRGLKRRLATSTLTFLEHSVWRRVDHVITVTEAYREVIARSGVPRERISVVLNTPDPAVMRPDQRREPKGGVYKIVFHGAVTDRSGIESVVRAMPRVLEEVSEAHVLVIGTGDGRRAVHTAIADLGLSNHVEFLDRYVALSEVVGYIADAHAGVVPTKRSSYTDHILPVRFLEYATLGVPIVATRLPLLDHYVGEEAAYFVPQPEPGAIAEGLIRLAQDPGYCRRIVQRARQFTQDHPWSRYADTLAKGLGLQAAE